MNDLGMFFVGGIVKVTVLATVGVVLALLLRRRGPSVGTLLTLTTLTGLVAVSVLSIGPWPALWSINIPGPLAEPPLTQGPTTETVADVGETLAPSAPGLAIAPSPTANFWRWPAWLALALISAWTFAAVRLALALIAVRNLRNQSAIINDLSLCEDIDILRSKLRLRKRIEARLCEVLTTPATVGWLKPMILLPPDWAEWSPVERQAVLAHELSHIQRNDYLSGLWGQVCLAAHAYHPLAHWLMSRLRLEQELAADAAGASLAGGNRLYLESLARLALRQSEPPAAWPVRPFLPTRGTFLRRIEMLRDPSAFAIKPTSFKTRAGVMALIGVTAIALTGMRTSQESKAAEKPEELRKKSFYHLKMIGLAMHNFHSANNHFPPASRAKPGSDFPYSWRVALLPYLDQQALYDEYDFNEAWDSPKNLKLVAKMPEVYRYPTEDATKGNAAYYVFSGPNTVFSPGSVGTPIDQIPDQIGNTLLVIESKREIPWTKPEDIDFDPEKFPGAAIPDLKPYVEEGYNVGFADGSARFIKKTIDPTILKALLSRAGGEKIDYSKF